MIKFHILACSCLALPTPFVEEAIFTTFYASTPFVEYYLTIETWVYFWALYSGSLVYVSVLISIQETVLSIGDRSAWRGPRSHSKMPVGSEVWHTGPMPMDRFSRG